MSTEETYNSQKEELLDINTSLSSLLSDVTSKSDISEQRFDEWLKSCSDIHNQIKDDIVRVAVIGAVKSGKSTFVNSLFSGDHLKRGAGVVTSIVTRIRSGNRVKAVLFFKSWDEINADIEQALVLLPSWEQKPDDRPFDIRREKDRRALSLALDQLSDDLLITDGVRNTSSVLLSLYLEGYDLVNEKISADSMTTEFTGEHFPEHRDYVGNDRLAVYLKDIELEIKYDNLDSSIEIADCQGSDSPNPLHLAMIQDYLLRTHFIVYIISSRTGLRQADIRFLSMIKKMGIIENILFVVNIDFSEHESLEDLKALIENVKNELALVRPDPDVYAFSALYNLFSSLGESLPKRDRLRLEQWKSEETFVNFATSEKQRFDSALNTKLTKERFGILLRNHLERMNVMVSGVERWARINRELLEKDIGGAKDLIRKMEHRQQRMEQIKALVKNTFSGATGDIMKGLKKDIDRFFNPNTGGVLDQTLNFVNQYSVSIEKYREKLMTAGFTNALYVAFQEFKQSLDTYMAETINPELAKFTANTEDRIRKSLESVAMPYQAMAMEDIAELKAAVSTDKADSPPATGNGQELLDLEAIKRIAGLSLPSSTATLQYYSRVRAEAVMRLGFYSVKKLFRKAFKKQGEDEKEEQMRALADGIKLIKRETTKSIVFHFENYRENFKFQYVSRLVSAASEHLHQLLMERFQSYNSDIKAMEKVIEKNGKEREDTIDLLDNAVLEARSIQGSIEKIRRKIQ